MYAVTEGCWSIGEKLLGFAIFDKDEKVLSAVYSIYRFEEKSVVRDYL